MGSIPARAGEPACRRGRCGFAGVYPRACGGTRRSLPVLLFPKGLSPRVRGNRRDTLRPSRSSRSIPARAGEPISAAAGIVVPTVYPRACGGTLPARDDKNIELGLSPRVRGNLRRNHRIRPVVRSIPARAGEPARWLSPPRPLGVYPRACGGTVIRRTEPVELMGLSPRVRGNRLRKGPRGPHLRSIPARAGEPPAGGACTPAAGVYPRACGGTPARSFSR